MATSPVECVCTTWPSSRGAARNFDEEAALVARAQASDQMAFRQIVERYQARVFSIIHRILRDRSEAEDIAQEVFASAFLSIGRFQCQGSLLTWLYRIAVNECYEYLRKKKVRKLVYESDLPEERGGGLETRSAAPPIDATLASRDLALKLLARLSLEDRCLLLMKEVEGYTVEEMSEMTGINANSIKVKLFRARRKLIKSASRTPLPLPASA